MPTRAVQGCQRVRVQGVAQMHLQCQSRASGLVRHPLQGHIGHQPAIGIRGVTSADIRMPPENLT